MHDLTNEEFLDLAASAALEGIIIAEKLIPKLEAIERIIAKLDPHGSHWLPGSLQKSHQEIAAEAYSIGLAMLQVKKNILKRQSEEGGF